MSEGSTTPKPCSVEGCERARKRKDSLCSMHRARRTRTGSVGSAKPMFTHGYQSPQCSIAGCSRPTRSLNLCAGHYARLNRTGDAGSDPVREKWERNDPLSYSYEVFHVRMRIDRGPARRHSCIACDKRAAQWAYQHNAPGEMYDAVSGLPYFPDPQYYEAMCRSCHVRLDKAKAALRRS